MDTSSAAEEKKGSVTNCEGPRRPPHALGGVPFWEVVVVVVSGESGRRWQSSPVQFRNIHVLSIIPLSQEVQKDSRHKTFQCVIKQSPTVLERDISFFSQTHTHTLTRCINTHTYSHSA